MSKLFALVLATLLCLGGQAREAGFACTARHPHFLRWWQPTQQHMATKAG